MEQKFKSQTKRILSGVIAATMTAAMFPAFPASAAENTNVYSFDGYDVEYSVTKEWDSAKNVEVKVTNTGDEAIRDWAFAYNAYGEICDLWNAAVSEKKETDYVIKNNSWNYEIKPDESINFGYTLTGDSQETPEDFKLITQGKGSTEGFDIRFNITDTWDTGVKGEIVIINTQDAPIDSWTLDFDSDLVIDKLWNGKITGSGDGHYTIESEKWTNSIPAGGTQTLGFTAAKTEENASAGNFELSCVNGKYDPDTSEDNTETIDDDRLTSLSENKTIDVIRNEDGQISTIDGRFTDMTVNSEQDAALVLNCASKIFGGSFSAVASDITVTQSDDETFYRYEPQINGVKVSGSQIILAVKDSLVTGLTSTYDRRISKVDLTASISSEKASDTALDSMIGSVDDIVSALAEKSGLSESEIKGLLRDSLSTDTTLAVYSDGENEPQLAWLVSVKNKLQYIDDGDIKSQIDYNNVYDYVRYVLHDTSNKYYISAGGDDAGEILFTDTNKKEWTPAAAEGVDLLGVNRSFEVEYKEPAFLSPAKFRMRDSFRNIETYETSFIPILGTPLLPGSMVQSKNNTWTNASAVSAHANVEKVFDYYNDKLGWYSYDGNGALIKATVDYRAPLFIIFGNVEYYNAFWNGSQFVFGDIGNLSAAVDVVGHEFTHAVIDYKVYDGEGENASRGLEYHDESGALNEAYADIMGSLAEGKAKNDSGRWLLGEDSMEPIRSMEQPSLFDQPENYQDMYQGDEDNGGVHINSGIINFAAYKMMTDDRTQNISDDEWSDVFYKSLNRLTTTSGFLDARGAILCTAKTSGGFNFEQLQAVKDAFDSVGITEPDCIHIVLTCPEGSGYLDSHLTGPAANSDSRFHVSFLGRNYYQDGTYMSDSSVFAADLEYDDSSSYCHEITSIYKLTPGDYCFYLHDYNNREETDSTALSLSGATVSVYRGASDTPMKLDDGITDAVFTPDSTHTGNLWSVFWIHIEQNGVITIIPKDTYSNHIWAETVGE